MRPVRAAGGAGLAAAESQAASASLRAAVAAAFSTEHGAILGYYAARIEAAKRGASPAAIIAAIRALLNEQSAALTSLANRRHAAEEQERLKAPERPQRGRRANGGFHAS